MKSWTGNEFLAFRGIRYAKPPIKELRFKAPVPPDPWNGVADAIKDGPSCVQFFGDYYGNPSEDCLFLNVYTKSLNGTRPVIVFFHPGGFFAQTAKSSQFGPDYLADEDIVLVTVNSRLGTLGYFSTGDEHAVGNYGLKDQVMSLKWVKQNIGHFGGDPTSVTIAGDGTGSTAVLLHMLSPMSKGLFHKAIAMSGGVMNKWAVMDDPSKYAKRIGQLLNCDTSSSKSIVDCLNRLPAQKIQDQLHSLRVNHPLF
ncbi:hypothetical protein AAG570_010505 [Ranatra chinensis]|uniref:Carboxylesterase type B domain-containing protein n=1 Tax=Ranatra chinensis TaxID=642074 RepID=A0ABD0Z4U8_9HEMI